MVDKMDEMNEEKAREIEGWGDSQRSLFGRIDADKRAAYEQAKGYLLRVEQEKKELAGRAHGAVIPGGTYRYLPEKDYQALLEAADRMAEANIHTHGHLSFASDCLRCLSERDYRALRGKMNGTN